MNALAEEVGETCNLVVPDREGMTHLDRVETKWPLRIQLPIGTQVPFYCTASGKLCLSSLRKSHLDRILGSIDPTPHTTATLSDKEYLMAELGRTRRQGCSRDAEEFMVGMIALAVPVLDIHKRLLATLSFHAPVQRMTLDKAVGHLLRLCGAASELEQLIR